MSEKTPGQLSWIARNAALAGPGDTADLAGTWDYLDPEQRDAEEAGADAARAGLVEELLAGVEEGEYGGDEPAEVLAVKYVRRLERERNELRVMLEKIHGAVEDAAPELRDAMAESRKRAEVLTEVLSWFHRSGSGHAARVGQVAIARAYRDAGLPVPEDLRRIS